MRLFTAKKNLDSEIFPQYNLQMKGITQKRIALLFVAVLFILALIPVFYPVEDETLRNDCPFCKAYNQLFAASNAFYEFDPNFCWIRTSSSLEISCNLPKALPSSTETRAPPA